MTTEEKTTKPFADLFEQAAKNQEQLLKTGVKLQQEMSKWWTTALGEAGTPDFQKRVKGVADDLFPHAQKNIDECLKLVEQNSRTSIDLLKKAVAVTQSTSLQDAQAKVFSVWEASLSALNEGTKALTQANTKATEAWLSFVQKAGTAAHTTAKS